jgi:hypothetical protein
MHHAPPTTHHPAQALDAAIRRHDPHALDALLMQFAAVIVSTTGAEVDRLEREIMVRAACCCCRALRAAVVRRNVLACAAVCAACCCRAAWCAVSWCAVVLWLTPPPLTAVPTHHP